MSYSELGHLQADDFVDLHRGTINASVIAHVLGPIYHKIRPIIVMLYSQSCQRCMEMQHSIIRAARRVMEDDDGPYVCLLRIDDPEEKKLNDALPHMLQAYDVFTADRVNKLKNKTLLEALQDILPLFIIYRSDGTFYTVERAKPKKYDSEEYYYALFKQWAANTRV